MESEADLLKEYSSESDESLSSKLMGKMQHLHERIDNPPERIAYQIRAISHCRLEVEVNIIVL